MMRAAEVRLGKLLGISTVVALAASSTLYIANRRNHVNTLARRLMEADTSNVAQVLDQINLLLEEDDALEVPKQ